MEQPIELRDVGETMTGRASAFLRRIASAEGTTLIETTIACAILLVAMGGLLGMSTMATGLTENQGHLAARTTEYAQDKMEQLLALKYGDTQSDTTVFPASNAGGSGLAVGGSLNTAAPAANYVDYLDQSGNLLVVVGNAAPAGWFYKRVWQVTSPSVNLKMISVTTIVARSVGIALIPQSTVAALKTSPVLGSDGDIRPGGADETDTDAFVGGRLFAA